MDHRRTPSKKALVLPGWFLTSSIALCVVGVVVLAVALVVGGGSGPTPTGTVATKTAVASTTPAPSSSSTTPSASPTTTTPTPTRTTTAAPTRDEPVAVFNNTGTTGLAAREAATVRAKGWTVVRIGNWRGVIPSNTVYYPAGRQAQAQLLADDLGLDRLRPAEPTMQQDRLTLVLSGPQQ